MAKNVHTGPGVEIPPKLAYTAFIMNELIAYVAKHPVYYVARDEERALGLLDQTEGYTIISNFPPFSKKNEPILGTRELMQVNGAKVPKGTNVLVFKNTKAIERIAADHDLRLLNPAAALANTIEEKVSQYAWLGELVALLPPTHISTCKDLTWSGEHYVVQFNHAHSGEGTRIITSQHDVDELIATFPDRPVRVSQFISGAMFTVNAVVHSSGVLVSTPSYQITGLSPFTDNAFTTIGNDWGAADALLIDEQKKQMNTIAIQIGEKMKTDGWKGLFGIDVVVEENTGKVYLIEINARQPASTTYESLLQKTKKQESKKAITTFEAHLAALLDLDLSKYTLVPVTSGSQIIQRITGEITEVDKDVVSNIEALGCTVRVYPNEKVGSELLRIQSNQSFISAHNELTTLGIQLVPLLTKEGLGEVSH